MDEKKPTPSRRKGKFIPKAPPQRKPKPTATESEVNEDEATQAKRLMHKFNENFRRNVPKAEKKSSVQVAFGSGAAPPSTSIKSYGVPGSQNVGGSRKLVISDSDDDEDMVISSLSTAKEDGDASYSSDTIDALPQKVKKDYKAPWDYNRSYYPTTLPLRRPYSGDPELLDEEEFGEAAITEYDENTIKPASDLGLLEESDSERLLLFQLPPKLPLVKRSVVAKGKDKAEGSASSQGKSGLKEEDNLEGLSEGYMGKMLVYKSGAVKLKLGDTLYDVSPGSDTIFAQHVMAVDTARKQCCSIGELEKRAIVTVDVDSLLNSL